MIVPLAAVAEELSHDSILWSDDARKRSETGMATHETDNPECEGRYYTFHPRKMSMQ
jgi:hypothetical protein